MKRDELGRALKVAVRAAQAAGDVLRRELHHAKRISAQQQHDIKLELDVRCQKKIERVLRSSFPRIPSLGEEGILGNPNAPTRWVVDPIDGTVNFTYGIPHACVSIALQARPPAEQSSRRRDAEEHQTLLGVVYDPFCDELWTATRGQPALLNGRVIHVSGRDQLRETIISMGFAKQRKTMAATLPIFNRLIRKVRKIRIMGAAALGLVYVATGRFDAYIESGIRLWDIAAGGLILECAGGVFWRMKIPGKYAYRLVASNGKLRKKLGPYAWSKPAGGSL